MENKVVVITGGSSGAGEALAYKFSSEGFNIVIGGTNIERLKKVQSNIKSIGTNCEFIVHDISIENAHSAVGDVKMLAECYSKYQKSITAMAEDRAGTVRAWNSLAD